MHYDILYYSIYAHSFIKCIYLHILYTYVLQYIVASTAPITEESSTKSWTLVQMVTTANTEKSNTKGI